MYDEYHEDTLMVSRQIAAVFFGPIAPLCVYLFKVNFKSISYDFRSFQVHVM